MFSFFHIGESSVQFPDNSKFSMLVEEEESSTTCEGDASQDIENGIEFQFKENLAAKARETQQNVKADYISSSDDGKTENSSTDEEIWETQEVLDTTEDQNNTGLEKELCALPAT